MSLSNYLEDALLNHIRDGATFTPPADLYVKLHTGDPGEAGTSNASAETTREIVTFGAASGGSMVSNGTQPEWTSWPAPADNETITHFSIWDNVSAGNCLGAGAWASGKTMDTGDTFAPTSITWTLD